MTMRRSISTAAAALGVVILLAGGAFAQGETPAPGAGNQQGRRQRGQGQRGQRQNPILIALRTLDTTAEQKAKLTPITEKFQADIRGLQSIPQAERRAKQRTLTQDFQKQVNDILTPEQREKLRREVALANGGPFGPAIRGLNLTSEQKVKVDPIVKDANEQIIKLQGDTSVRGAERRDKIQAIVRETVAKVGPSLTADQKTTLETAAARIGQRGGTGRRNQGAGGGGARGAARPGNGNTTP